MREFTSTTYFLNPIKGITKISLQKIPLYLRGFEISHNWQKSKVQKSFLDRLQRALQSLTYIFIACFKFLETVLIILVSFSEKERLQTDFKQFFIFHSVKRDVTYNSVYTVLKMMLSSSVNKMNERICLRENYSDLLYYYLLANVILSWFGILYFVKNKYY